jgi:hypothetical protein
MTEKKSSFPNVSLGEKYAGNLRYREKDQSDEESSKKW